MRPSNGVSLRLQPGQGGERRVCQFGFRGDHSKPDLPFVDRHFVFARGGVVEADRPESAQAPFRQVAERHRLSAGGRCGPKKELRRDALAVRTLVQARCHQDEAPLGGAGGHVEQQFLLLGPFRLEGKCSHGRALGIEQQRILAQFRRETALIESGHDNEREPEPAGCARRKQVDSVALESADRIRTGSNRFEKNGPQPFVRHEPGLVEN